MRRTYLMSVEQLCTIIAALMLASCVRVHAQFGVEQPFFFQQAPAAPVNPLPGNLAYRWVFTNLATNTPVTGWTDVVQGVVFTALYNTNTPTNTSSGVLFSGTKTLMSTTALPADTYSSTTAQAFVYYMIPTAGQTAAQYLLKREASSSGHLMNYQHDGDFQQKTLGYDVAVGIPKGVAINITLNRTNNNPTTTAVRCYTNAVFSGEEPNPAVLQYDALASSGSPPYYSILELQIYTNGSGSACLTLSQITNIYKFFTNAYYGL